MKTNYQVCVALIVCTAMLVSAFNGEDAPTEGTRNPRHNFEDKDAAVSSSAGRSKMAALLCQIVIQSACRNSMHGSSETQGSGMSMENIDQGDPQCSSALQTCNPILRGRRNGTPIAVNPDSPPGFFASRGRRSNQSSGNSEDSGHHRTNDPNLQNNQFPNLYVRGFLGTRG